MLVGVVGCMMRVPPDSEVRGEVLLADATDDAEEPGRWEEEGVCSQPPADLRGADPRQRASGHAPALRACRTTACRFSPSSIVCRPALDAEYDML
ncbi:hypothetical protein AURDEDRAFT_178576 [Auricularia subglabra TFB-10046 SS5]|uniref:Uncharacterized protein n=1 Tax=Auricularia subglabra (strain TFB-10046 / SS5) TaxID=717982 RepID=J0L7Q4_AURST|nr:hypothetical protein AURDEDRAFT_178576 [Auricularia subglabra TFB-10046 SS5]